MVTINIILGKCNGAVTVTLVRILFLFVWWLLLFFCFFLGGAEIIYLGVCVQERERGQRFSDENTEKLMTQ